MAKTSRAAYNAMVSLRRLMRGVDEAAGMELGRLMDPKVFRTLPPDLQAAVLRGDYRAVLRARGPGHGLEDDATDGLAERMGVLVPENMVRRQSFDLIPQQPRGLSVPQKSAAEQFIGDPANLSLLENTVDELGNPITPIGPRTGVLVPEDQVRRPAFGMVPRQSTALSVQRPPALYDILGDNPEDVLPLTHTVDELGNIVPPFLDGRSRAGRMLREGLRPTDYRSGGLAALAAAALSGAAGMDAVMSPDEPVDPVGIMPPQPEEPMDVEATVVDGMPVFDIPSSEDDTLSLSEDPSATAMLAAETSQLPVVMAGDNQAAAMMPGVREYMGGGQAEAEAEAMLAKLMPFIGEEDARLLRYQLQSGASYQEALAAMIEATR